MCGRFTLRTSPQAVAKAFRLVGVPDFSPRYKIAQTQQVLAIRQIGETACRLGRDRKHSCRET
jgi:putative SOS response-associated peptidase YedK